MKVVLATGIYPPEIGGPATYVEKLAEELSDMDIETCVVTYGVEECLVKSGKWKVVVVSKMGGPFIRWWRYAKALKEHASDADIVYAFSSVSCGVPLWLARLRGPQKVLRLGGDFFWERYTDCGGRKSLREWYRKKRSHVRTFARFVMQRILSRFDHIVFSTEFQRDLYRDNYRLPQNSVIENAVPTSRAREVERTKRSPFRLLVMSRLVRFKNLDSLVQAMQMLPNDFQLTIVGDGPRKRRLQRLVTQLDLHGRVAFTSSVHGKEKRSLMDMHDLLVLPSLTEISPNAALEARSNGLPVLLTEETGLSESLKRDMIVKPLRTPEQIATAVHEISDSYPMSTSAPEARPWSIVAQKHLDLFRSLA